MKNLLNITITVFLFFLLFLVSVNTSAQVKAFPTFGQDIVLNDIPDQNQKLTATCTAFNGWIYAVYTYYNPITDRDTFVFLRSEDGGVTWNFILQHHFTTTIARCTFIKLYVTGSTVSLLKIIFICAVHSDIDHWENVYVYECDGNTGVYLKTLFTTTLATFLDCILENTCSSSTFAVLFPQDVYGNDRLNFYHTTDGGVSFKEVIITANQEKIHKARLGFGRSLSHPEGIYYAVWEQQDSWDPVPGRIYTAHTFGDTSYAFSNPVRLDILEAGMAGLCSEPVIACQNNIADNSSSDITEIIFFNKETPSGQKKIVGYKNLSSTSDTIFTKIALPDSISETEQPEITFAPYDSSFYLTYYNKTTGKIPLLKNDLNITGWEEITNGYNDDTLPSNPFARITANEIDEQIMCSWINKTGDNGIAMYDSENSTYNYIGKYGKRTSVSVFPNPCSGKTNLIINPEYKTDANLDIFDISSDKLISMYHNYDYSISFNIDLSTFPDGIYVYKIKTREENLIGKIILKKL